MILSASREQKNVPSRCTASMRRQFSSVMSTVASRCVTIGPPARHLGHLLQLLVAELRGERGVALHAADAGVVHQHVEPAAALRDLLEHARDRGRVRHVGGDRDAAERRGGLLGQDRIEIVDHDARALLDVALGDRESDAARRSGDQCDLAVQSIHSGSPCRRGVIMPRFGVSFSTRLAMPADLERLLPLVRELWKHEHMEWDDDAHAGRARAPARRRVARPRLDLRGRGPRDRVPGALLRLQPGVLRPRRVHRRALHRPRVPEPRPRLRSVLATVEAACRELDVRALHLEVDHVNERAKGLYKRAGYADHDRWLMTEGAD